MEKIVARGLMIASIVGTFSLDTVRSTRDTPQLRCRVWEMRFRAEDRAGSSSRRTGAEEYCRELISLADSAELAHSSSRMINEIQ
jgi:hypothetical protein